MTPAATSSPMWGWAKRKLGLEPAEHSIDRLTYAIGDIHGERKLLARLLDKIEEDRDGEPAELIFLGDYVDRGPDSAGVISDLLDPDRLSGVETVFLKGNHEATVLDFLGDAELGPIWATFGGAETLASYGVRAPSGPQEPDAWQACHLAFCEAFPDSHRRFMEGLDVLVQRGDYLFVHAGIDPTRPLDDQGETEFLWIREAFLESDKPMPWKVVHGHTPEEQPTHDRRRIGIDTGAYLTGRLTAARLCGTHVGFIST